MRSAVLAAINVLVVLAGVSPVAAADEKVVVADGVPLQATGLFGPSRREIAAQMACLQQQHIAVSRDSNTTLHRMEVEQARQTEILRQIAGQTAKAADATQRAADSSQQLGQYLLTKPLRDYPALPSDAPRDIRNLPNVQPTLPDLRSSQPLPSDSPGSIRGTPDINVGPVLQGTSGRTYYTKSALRK